jgi:phage terminase large subunit-like protein
LIAASQNLYELIQSQSLVAYPDPNIRLAISRAVAIETSRGWKISKTTQTHKIDFVIALAMAALAAIRGQAERYYNLAALAS